jgi:hypothetical protein
MKHADNILYIATNNLFLRFGGGLAIRAFYEGVKKLYPNKVDLILPQESCEYVEDKIDIFGVPRRNKIVAVVLSLLGHLHRYRKYIFLHLKKHSKKYKICIINGGVYAGDMIDHIKSLGINVVVIHHNYEKEYHIDNKTSLTFWGKFPYYVCRNEKNAYYKADLNLFLTNSDIELFKNNYGPCAGLIGLLGVFEPFSAMPPSQIQKRRNHTIIISGSLDSYQTESGIEDFFSHYYKIINEEFSKLNILIAGRNPTDRIKKFSEQYRRNVNIISNPADMDSITGKCLIYCCPTNIGGGLKLRIMDGLRLGLPVLTHIVSSRGYDAFFDKPYFKIYKDEEGFRDGISCLMKLYENNMIDHGQIQCDYNSYFSFEAGRERLDKYLSLIK